LMAPVLAEPSLPFVFPVLRGLQKGAQAALSISPEELEKAKERSRTNGLPILGFRFSNDWICPARRFETLEQQFGANFVTHVIPSGASKRYPKKNAHSVLTVEYKFLDESLRNNPAKDPRIQVLTFLHKQLILTRTTQPLVPALRLASPPVNPGE